MKKTKSSRKASKQGADLSGWFSPVTQAKYWAGLIGRIVKASGKGAQAQCHIVFEYKRDGTKLPKPEEFTFPRARLQLVKDFAARVKKHLTVPSQPSTYSDLAVIECEEI